MSTKVKKYQGIIDNKIKKYGFCNTILIRKIMGEDSVILLQNAFPTLEKYIDHIHTTNGIPVKVIDSLKNKILSNFKKLLRLKKNGINLFYVDIDKIKDMMLEEVYVAL
ncbi:MAG: hypothetical protein PHW32_04260 [Bacilli bacterium]|nr:hypothetical protein [Bacilli bacterium]MDD4283055.1 hypothetical protein [Bacilli bacterium]MDD4719135.1 hypothetical protein [Bacilli bacterium]